MISKFNITPARVGAYVLGAVVALAPVAASAQTSSVPVLDTTGYNTVFTTLNTDIAGVATGPIGLGAFGVLTIGIVFRLVWRLYKNAPKSLA